MGGTKGKTKVKTHLPAAQTYIKTLGLLPKGSIQTFIDSEIARLSDNYAPSDTGALRKSVFANSKFGSGKLEYDIYGSAQGRNTWNDETSRFQDAPRRGPRWVTRMWNNGGREKVMLGVKKLLGRKG